MGTENIIISFLVAGVNGALIGFGFYGLKLIRDFFRNKKNHIDKPVISGTIIQKVFKVISIIAGILIIGIIILVLLSFIIVLFGK